MLAVSGLVRLSGLADSERREVLSTAAQLPDSVAARLEETLRGRPDPAALLRELAPYMPKLDIIAEKTCGSRLGEALELDVEAGSREITEYTRDIACTILGIVKAQRLLGTDLADKVASEIGDVLAVEDVPAVEIRDGNVVCFSGYFRDEAGDYLAESVAEILQSVGIEIRTCAGASESELADLALEKLRARKRT